MSIVGPRPLLISYLPWYTEREKHRHDVRPGLSGLAQINDKLLKEMENADVYIQNSLYETFGLAVIEALDAGCSLLLSNKMGCVELFENLKGKLAISNGGCKN